jgi:Family of unknown function (DUF6498)
MVRLLILPKMLAILVINLIPLYGVLYWDWETFQLLMLYWIETVMIAFWTIRRLALLPGDQMPRARIKRADRVEFSMAGFVTLHAGIFITVHFVLLWAFFSYGWFKKVHGVGSFFFELFVANGIWAAMLLMALFHWVSFRTDPLVAGARHGATIGLVQAQQRTGEQSVTPIVLGLYARIFIMQIAILLGAWLSGFSGSLAPLVIVIVLKTLLDVGLGAFTPNTAMAVSTSATSRER